MVWLANVKPGDAFFLIMTASARESAHSRWRLLCSSRLRHRNLRCTALQNGRTVVFACTDVAEMCALGWRVGQDCSVCCNGSSKPVQAMKTDELDFFTGVCNGAGVRFGCWFLKSSAWQMSGSAVYCNASKLHRTVSCAALRHHPASFLVFAPKLHAERGALLETFVPCSLCW